MNAVRISSLLGALCLAVSISAPCYSATIGFDGLDSTSGQPALVSFSESGFMFNVSVSAGDGTARIFNTLCDDNTIDCNGDTDLIPIVQGENGISGNVLIIQNGGDIPNDSASGGDIILESTGGNQPFRFVGASAIDDGTFTFFSRIGTDVTQLAQIMLDDENETGSASFTSGLIAPGDAIIIRYSGSGGIDSLVVQAVPLPAAAWLFLSGLAGLFGVKRFRRA